MKIHVFQFQDDEPNKMAALVKPRTIIRPKAVTLTKSVTFRTAHNKTIYLIKNTGQFKIQNRDKGPPRVRDPERFKKQQY